MNGHRKRVTQLMERGVTIHCPESVEIGPEVDLERISGNGVVIHSGSRIYGASTLILRDTVIGREGPVSLDNCQVGPEVNLKGGYFSNAVFLKGASMGSGAHVRQGTILEEQASGAHTVGLKQTILFPFVTLGSLINFCDCLMAGGTDRKNHSEVGSSYIHFNYTPNQDKATPSLMGDVPQGVMLNQPPIFLGGQGGLVGPRRLAFGTVVAAGSICRKDELRPGRLIIETGGKRGNIPYGAQGYQIVKPIVTNNLNYIANLMALRQWYLHVRKQFISEDFPEALHKGLVHTIDNGIEERLRRLGDYLIRGSLPGLGANEKNSSMANTWDQLRTCLENCLGCEGDPSLRDDFLLRLDATQQKNGTHEYLPVIKSLTPESAHIGTQWLQGIVDDIMDQATACLPMYRPSTP